MVIRAATIISHHASRARGAMTLAEGLLPFKTDASLIFGGRHNPKWILRTVFDPLDSWVNKHHAFNAHSDNSKISVPVMAPFSYNHKQVAIIEREFWTFQIDATSPEDIVTAVRGAGEYYKIEPSELLSAVYAKNLNSENQNLILGNSPTSEQKQALIRANQELYRETTAAIIEASRHLKFHKEINFYVFSNNTNPKIPNLASPKDYLHQGIIAGGAVSVETEKNDDGRDKRHIVTSASNDGLQSLQHETHFHLATLRP